MMESDLHAFPPNACTLLKAFAERRMTGRYPSSELQEFERELRCLLQP